MLTCFLRYGCTLVLTHTGVELMLYGAGVWLILEDRKRKKNPRANRTFLLISTLLIAMNTIFFATQAFFGEDMWIVNEDFPGGSAVWFVENAAIWYQTFGTTACVIQNAVSDGFQVRTPDEASLLACMGKHERLTKTIGDC